MPQCPGRLDARSSNYSNTLTVLIFMEPEETKAREDPTGNLPNVFKNHFSNTLS
jgi:hypothetical protein